MSNINLHTAFRVLYPEANFEWIIENEEYLFKNLTSDVDVTESELEEKTILLRAEFDAQEYARNRVLAYDSVGNQLDQQYWDQVNGTTTWKDGIAKVKSDNPKPE